MPKDRRSRSVSFDRPSPLPSRSSDLRRRSPLPSSSSNRSPLTSSTDSQKWDEIRCPVCMDHPHNAVLLLCSSHDKGCRPFMCDTSYRHSNCLDQYRKAVESSMSGEDSKPILSCPLCRGVVSGSKVVEAARRNMNAKERSCSTEACGFSGAYGELRKHARTEHPLVRPTEMDPERERDWRRMEQQRDLGDLVSTMQSALRGEEEEEEEEEDGLAFLAEGGEMGGMLPFPTITFFLVLRFRGTGGMSGGGGWEDRRRRGSVRSARSRRGRERGRGRALWGESIVEAEGGSRERDDVDDDDVDYEEEEEEEEEEDNDGGERRRQRRTRRQLRMVDDEDDDGGV